MKPITVLRKPIKCQKCGKKTVVKILYGEPNLESWELSEKGALVLGGCIVHEENPQWACTHCQTEYKKKK